jgi:hypothetical protein
MTQQEVLKQLVEVRIKRVLLKNRTEFELELYNRVGRGVTPQEYLAVVNKMIGDGVITRTTGVRGAKSLHLAEGNSNAEANQSTEVTCGSANA